MERKKKRKYYITLKLAVVTFQRFLFRQAAQYKNQRTEVQLECHWGLELPRRSGGKWKLLIVAIFAYFVLCYNALCDCEKKIICSVIFCHCHFNWLFTAVEMAECIVSLRGKGKNYFNQLHFLALTQYVSYSVSCLPGAALQGKKGEPSFLATLMNY